MRATVYVGSSHFQALESRRKSHCLVQQMKGEIREIISMVDMDIPIDLLEGLIS